ncbi:hypothetical protein JRO89_XS02G0013400 [Xanthoceras sorbifolium]|uniref:Uncharacterized protein n=1 Tax=Xanthoceras sorbifolium TaxID=99658 RepID=A0ABQ8IEJ3_9ROSI|nr:hypothetical protein JRO89_XS02G0013400 [Xanthoceras sorbifolium]
MAGLVMLFDWKSELQDKYEDGKQRLLAKDRSNALSTSFAADLWIKETACSMKTASQGNAPTACRVRSFSATDDVLQLPASTTLVVFGNETVFRLLATSFFHFFAILISIFGLFMFYIYQHLNAMLLFGRRLWKWIGYRDIKLFKWLACSVISKNPSHHMAVDQCRHHFDSSCQVI